ncbi:hypothetical protein JJD41_17750 [Oxynema sp. CENA135]|uniref:hypothetical protein n=1 Tax=Oxynema sp. CENA135 TaxID=984206 RepID=UPI00190A7556|nr:hypothetical protein [Oxynema sp. CENA135]MBK4731696.1 hypothetical protein [Oxynema sp. CENA135]
MALTEEEEQKVRELLQREGVEQRRVILKSKENFKEWLKEVAYYLLERLTEAAIDILLRILLDMLIIK